MAVLPEHLDTAAKPGPSLRVALVILAVGAVIVVPTALIGGIRVFRGVNPPSIATPSVTSHRLGSGRWDIFQRTGTRSSTGGINFGHNDAPDLDPSQVKVTGPDGAAVAVFLVDSDETISRNSVVYTAALGFDVPTTGVYSVAVDTPTPDAVLLARPLDRLFRSLIAPLATGAVGGLVIVTGLILLLVGVVRRSQVPRAAGGPAGPGTWSANPGWYPDPQVPGRKRWWDGARWTDHQG